MDIITTMIFCVYHDDSKLDEIKKIQHLTPYNINMYKNGEMNKCICEYICQQNNYDCDYDYVGFCNVGRYINIDKISLLENDFLIYSILNYSIKYYLEEILCLKYTPELLNIIYEYLKTYNITNIEENCDWARFELYVAKKSAYQKLVDFINGLLESIFNHYNQEYNYEGCKNIVENEYMNKLNIAFRNNQLEKELSNGNWYINSNSKFYTSIDEEIEYVQYITNKFDYNHRYGNQFRRIFAYIIEFFIGYYICNISKNYIIENDLK